MISTRREWPHGVETRPSALPPLGWLLNLCAEVMFNTAESIRRTVK